MIEKPHNHRDSFIAVYYKINASALNHVRFETKCMADGLYKVWRRANKTTHHTIKPGAPLQRTNQRRLETCIVRHRLAVIVRVCSVPQAFRAVLVEYRDQIQSVLTVPGVSPCTKSKVSVLHKICVRKSTVFRFVAPELHHFLQISSVHHQKLHQNG